MIGAQGSSWAVDWNGLYGYLYGHQEVHMPRYSVAQAKDRLSELISRAEAGEEVVITRRGEPVVELRTPRSTEARSPETLRWLVERARADGPVGMSSVELLRQMYDEDEA
jgi:prevent-host-death family protein